MATRLSFRCDPDLVERVNALRGQVPRERWLRDAIVLACESREAGATPSVAVEQALAVRRSESDAMLSDNADSVPRKFEPAPTAAPAEQSVPSVEYRTFSPLGPPGRARRSDEAKRGVQPIEKGGKR